MTHEPHFCLLREVVSFSGGSRGRPSREVLENPCQESFILFQIGLLREYLELEFRNDALPFAYNVERVIDDFVLFCMLIGNDFLPGMPTVLSDHVDLCSDVLATTAHDKLKCNSNGYPLPSKHDSSCQAYVTILSSGYTMICLTYVTFFVQRL